MATISQALTREVLHEYRLPGHDGREPRRPIYLSTWLMDWVDQTDEMHTLNWGRNHGSRTRFEHLEQALSDFRCDFLPLVGDMNRVIPTRLGVWKLQAPGVRVFGWVPAPHQFVAVRPALAEHTHGPGNIVDECVEFVLNFAKVHGLQQTIMRGDRIALFPSTAR